MASVHHIINIPLYNSRVDLYVVNSVKDIDEVYENKWPGIKSEVSSSTVAHALWAHNKFIDNFALFIVDGEATYAHIAHEVLHITYYMMDFLGIKVDSHNHEAQAYLLEYLVRKVSETCEKQKVKFI